jgi:DNA-binding MarR family transcriptional regulator
MTDRTALSEALLTASRALVGISVRSIEASPVDVTVLQHRLLVVLASHGEQTITGIAEALGINQSNATRHCDRLQRLGLVGRRRADHDGRVVLVQLTHRGMEVLDRVTRRRREEIERVLAKMTVSQARSALTALAAFNDAADELPDWDWAW